MYTLYRPDITATWVFFLRNTVTLFRSSAQQGDWRVVEHVEFNSASDAVDWNELREVQKAGTNEMSTTNNMLLEQKTYTSYLRGETLAHPVKCVKKLQKRKYLRK